MATLNHLANSRSYGHSEGGRRCCGFSKSLIAFTLNVFNFVLFFSGLIILTIVLFYESSNISAQSSYHLALIRSILPTFHSLNLIYYQLVGCGILMCILAGLNMFLNVYHNTKKKQKERQLKQEMLDGMDNEIDGMVLNNSGSFSR